MLINSKLTLILQLVHVFFEREQFFYFMKVLFKLFCVKFTYLLNPESVNH